MTIALPQVLSGASKFFERISPSTAQLISESLLPASKNFVDHRGFRCHERGGLRYVQVFVPQPCHFVLRWYGRCSSPVRKCLRRIFLRKYEFVDPRSELKPR